jgi:hypothetical protein
MTLRKQEDTGSWRRKLKGTQFGRGYWPVARQTNTCYQTNIKTSLFYPLLHTLAKILTYLTLRTTVTVYSPNTCLTLDIKFVSSPRTQLKQFGWSEDRHKLWNISTFLLRALLDGEFVIHKRWWPNFSPTLYDTWIYNKCSHMTKYILLQPWSKKRCNSSVICVFTIKETNWTNISFIVFE